MTKKHCTTFSELKQKALADPAVRAAYREARRSWKLCDLQIDEQHCVESEPPIDIGKKQQLRKNKQR